ncbi:MAG: hypothetical protein EOO61_05440 [Hymenobacter sp.]|nr:MAG: hypothetical protein EOO61_05440 [Hymenobacter sp.]
MKKLLLLPAMLYCSSAALAQTSNCSALQTENAALKDKMVAYEARLGIGVGGVKVADGDDKIKVKFLSCKASKSTHKAEFAFMVVNSDEPAGLRIFEDGQLSSAFYDEQGHGYTMGGVHIGAASHNAVGGSAISIPSNTPVRCTMTLNSVPTSATYLNTAFLSFSKEIPGMGKTIPFKTALMNVPITWVP